MHLVQCAIIPTWMMGYYEEDGEGVGEGGRHIPLRLVNPFHVEENDLKSMAVGMLAFPAELKHISVL